ncbi:MAG: hypothetical protein ABIA77_06505 [Candidatus Omnitrophota bacterium]
MKTKGFYATVITLLILCSSFTQEASGSLVDIASQVVWEEDLQMYIPLEYTHSWYYEGYTSTNDRIVAGLYIDFAPTYGFDMYLTASVLSHQQVRLTDVTLANSQGIDIPPTIMDYGYLPNGAKDKPLTYIATDRGDQGGPLMLDWHIEAINPQPHNSVYPGSIYYGAFEGIDVDPAVFVDRELIASFTGRGGGKTAVPGVLTYAALPTGDAAVSELPKGIIGPMCMVALMGIAWKKREGSEKKHNTHKRNA